MDAFRRADVGLGHTGSFAAVGSMSGLTPGADILAAFRHFRKVPILLQKSEIARR